MLGAGKVGAGLGRFWVDAGHDVTLTLTRDEAKLKATAAAINAAYAAPADAVREADVVVIAVPWASIGDALAQAGSLDGKVVVDCTNNLTGEDEDVTGPDRIGRAAPGCRVVKAFNSVFAALYDEIALSDVRADMAFCGDDEEAKKVVAGLIRDAGFEPVDCGGSDAAGGVEDFGRFVIALCYRAGRGPFTYQLRPPSKLG